MGKDVKQGNVSLTQLTGREILESDSRNRTKGKEERHTYDAHGYDTIRLVHDYGTNTRNRHAEQ